MRIAALLTTTLLLAGCVASTNELRHKISATASQSGFTPAIEQTSRFKIFTLKKLGNGTGPVRIYVEGDGKAFTATGMPSSDPTPMKTTLFELAQVDDAENIVYIARPCQFTENDKNCSELYWTTGRFSADAVNAVNEVVSQYKNREVEIIGYSGGAAISLFLIPKNPNIISFRSIAGNLDHVAFTTLHGSIPLADSLQPPEYIRAASNLPQVHFSGDDDQIVPSFVAESYKAQQLSQNCSQYYTIKDTDHSDGWFQEWPRLLKIQPRCN